MTGGGLDLCLHSPIEDSSSSIYNIKLRQELTAPTTPNGFIQNDISKKYYLPRLVVEINYTSICQYPGGLKVEGDSDTTDESSNNSHTVATTPEPKRKRV